MFKTSKTLCMGGGAYKSSNHVAVKEAVARKQGGFEAKSLGFTLAEVLITLAIIGVVAALTIPTVVSKYQKHQYYTQFMKAYNTLSEAFSMAQAEYGDINNWGFIRQGGHDITNGEEIFNKVVLPYLKVSKSCTSATPCDFESSPILYLSSEGNDEMKEDESYMNYSLLSENSYILEDGTLIFLEQVDYNNSRIIMEIYFDTNGPKGPNVFGRDLFELYYLKLNNKDVLRANNNCFEGNRLVGASGITPDNFFQLFEATNDSDRNCTTNTSSAGYGCAGRLLYEHKMNY